MRIGHDSRVASPLGHATVSTAERASVGRAERRRVPRHTLGTWEPPAGRPEPAALLAAQDVVRVAEFVPARHERMSVDAFHFFRGSAAVMAWDLAHSPHTRLFAQLGGDAHLANFGVFAAPNRALLFDANDFDETLPGPWDFDVRRLVASLAIAARQNGFPAASADAAVREAIRTYRTATRRFAATPDLLVWYARMPASSVLGALKSSAMRELVAATLAKASRNTAEKVLRRATETVDGVRRFRSDPPILVRIEDLTEPHRTEARGDLEDALAAYRETLHPYLRVLLERYVVVDAAYRMVGVGSVGTRDYVVLLLGRRLGDPLILQIKEATRSVHEDFLTGSRFGHHGERVVAGQRLLQAASDLFLGWLDGAGGRAYYVRQFRDAKGSLDLERLTPKVLRRYAEACAWTLARGHARSGDAVALAAYLGTGSAFDRAMVAFARDYADQNERDYASYLARGTG